MSGEPGQTKQNLNKQGVMRSRTTEEEEGPTVRCRPEARMLINSRRKKDERIQLTMTQDVNLSSFQVKYSSWRGGKCSHDTISGDFVEECPQMEGAELAMLVPSVCC